jgi:CRP-like cAMP-binding protein
VRNQTRKETNVMDLYPGMMFGEVSLLFKTKRTCSVKTVEQCTVGALSEEHFYEMCKQFPEIEKRMKEATRTYNDSWKNF